MVPDIRLRQGDTLPAIESTLLDPQGKQVDLAGATVAFVMRVANLSAPATILPVTIVDAAAGLVRYQWQPADTAAAGDFFGYWLVIFPGLGQVETHLNSRDLLIEIVPALYAVNGVIPPIVTIPVPISGYWSQAPLPDGTAAPGNSPLVARGDHVHPASNQGVRATSTSDGTMSLIDRQKLMLSWWRQREERAIYVLNRKSIQVDTPLPFNYAVSSPVISGPVSIDLTRSGVVYKMTGLSAALYDMPSGAKLVHSPKTESFYVARRISYDALLVATNVFPLSLDDANVPTDYIQLGIFAPSSPTHFQLFMGTAGALTGGSRTAQVDLGPSCAIGSALCPPRAPITLAAYFSMNPEPMDPNSEAILVFEVNDVEVLRLKASDGGLDAMPQTALRMGCFSADGSVTQRVYGGFAMIKGATS